MAYALWFMVIGLGSIVYGPEKVPAAHGLWSMIYGPWFVAYDLWPMVYGPMPSPRAAGAAGSVLLAYGLWPTDHRP